MYFTAKLNVKQYLKYKDQIMDIPQLMQAATAEKGVRQILILGGLKHDPGKF